MDFWNSAVQAAEKAAKAAKDLGKKGLVRRRRAAAQHGAAALAA